MLKKKKIILAIGCSYADPSYYSTVEHLPPEKRGGWPMWPEIFKNNLEKETGISYELINLARSGASSDYMFVMLTQYIAKHSDQIEFVLQSGSQWHRSMDWKMRPYNSMIYEFMKDLYHHKGRDGTSQHYRDEGWIHFCKAGKYNTVNNEYTQRGIKKTIDLHLSYMWSILNICNNNKIKFLHYQLMHIFPHYKFLLQAIESWGESTDKIDKTVMDPSWQSSYMLKTPYAKYIVENKEKILGFQMLGEEPWDRQSLEEKERLRIFINKTSVDKAFLRKSGEKQKLDGHPNADGQKDIGDKLWKHYVHNLA